MTAETNRYWAAVDNEAQNNSHSIALRFVGDNKRVLELGPAAGHVTRALVDRGCTVVGIEVEADAAAALEGVAECHVGNLDDPSIVAKVAGDRTFEVILAGDVLEHLRNPLDVLMACRRVLAPGGYVVISVPNITHADVAMALADGRFPYGDWGLLDRTHVHFFTLDELATTIRSAGLLMIDLERVVYPVFTTELGVTASDFDGAFVDRLMQNRESETYQFVCRAVAHDGDVEVARLAERAIEADDRSRRLHADQLRVQADLAIAQRDLAELRAANDQVVAALQYESATARNVEQHLHAVLNTKSMRALRIPRAVYRKLRGAGV